MGRSTVLYTGRCAHSGSCSCHGVSETVTHCGQVIAHWCGRAVHLLTIGADRLSTTVSSVEGLSDLVRLATATSHVAATIAERLFDSSTGIRRFSQEEFDALVAGTDLLSDPAYFLCGDAKKDIQKGRYFWVAGKFCSTIVHLEQFAVWVHSFGIEELNNACESLSKSKALRWTRTVSMTKIVGCVAIGASTFKCIERIRDYQKGDRPIFAVIDGCSQAAEAALSLSEMVPFCGELTIAVLGFVAAVLGIASYLTDISTVDQT